MKCLAKYCSLLPNAGMDTIESQSLTHQRKFGRCTGNDSTASILIGDEVLSSSATLTQGLSAPPLYSASCHVTTPSGSRRVILWTPWSCFDPPFSSWQYQEQQQQQQQHEEEKGEEGEYDSIIQKAPESDPGCLLVNDQQVILNRTKRELPS